MSNLGWYQIIVEWSKKVGGPQNLIALIASGGMAIGGTAVAGGSFLKKVIDKKLEDKKRQAEATIIHVVKKDGTSNEGLAFFEGDKFRILEIAGDAALIEKIGDENSPYFASVKFLGMISDFEDN